MRLFAWLFGLALASGPELVRAQAPEGEAPPPAETIPVAGTSPGDAPDAVATDSAAAAGAAPTEEAPSAATDGDASRVDEVSDETPPPVSVSVGAVVADEQEAVTVAAVPAPEEKKKQPSELSLSGRILAQYQWGTPYGAPSRVGVDDPEHEFLIDSARVGVRWERPTLRAEVELELFDRDSLDDFTPEAKDAWIQYSPWQALRVRAGQFKKPVSRLRMESRTKLPVISRGIVVGQLMGELGYGGRDIGLLVGGRVGDDLRLTYAGGVFNGAGANELESDGNSAKDLAMRLEVAWRKLVSLGLDASRKNLDPRENPARGGTLLGADVEIDVLGFEGLIEAHWGWDPFVPDAVTGDLPVTAGVIGYARYRFELPAELELEPVVGAEVYVPNTDLGFRILRQFGGLNLHVGKPLRLMLQVEQTARPGQQDADRALVLQLAFEE